MIYAISTITTNAARQAPTMIGMTLESLSLSALQRVAKEKNEC